jgi:uncharacterized protein
MSTMTFHGIEISQEDIAALCRKWKIVELALFGSVLRDDFRRDSDVDVLVTFADDAPWSSWDLVDAQLDLQRLFGHEVDLVEKRTVVNPFRRHAIFSSKQVIYAA